ncbi:MAG: hypothetical protein P4N59_03305 [Negativicutes bacterium]|nr:hypothetical protein [Negativicutes bacterium]
MDELRYLAGIIGLVTMIFLIYSVPYMYRKMRNHTNDWGSPPEVMFAFMYVLLIPFLIICLIYYIILLLQWWSIAAFFIIIWAFMWLDSWMTNTKKPLA